ncbi:MAG: S9 family peptidase, partial [Gammaproteobacteria bacterium]
TEKEFLDQWSPVNHVEKIQAPIFMAYGKQDPRVVLKHAENLEKEMKKYNKPYQLMVKKDEGHGYRKLENQLDFYGTMETFLAANIGS